MDLNRTVDRRIYPTLQWDRSLLKEHFGNAGALPFWVADMEFRAPEAVIDSLLRRVEHGVFGYEYRRDSLLEALVDWYERRHQWSIDPEQVEQCPGVLSGLSILIDQHSDEGDGIIIQPPVFFEFRSVIRSNGRRIVKNPLRIVDGQYRIDFEDLEEKAGRAETSILIMCNPHNPVGRVWREDELAQVAEICRQHEVFIISDEIHGDIVYEPHRYTPLASVSDALVGMSATCLSPGKTFNISGAVDAMAVIGDEEHRTRFHDFTHRYQVNKTNVFASAAIEAAYRQGGEWLDTVLAYLRSNVDFLNAWLHDHLPRVTLVEPEGTFLVWLDFRALGLEVKELERFLAQEAGLALSPGYWFGREGAGYARMNIACPRGMLEDALTRLTDAINGHPCAISHV